MIFIILTSLIYFKLKNIKLINSKIFYLSYIIIILKKLI